MALNARATGEDVAALCSFAIVTAQNSAPSAITRVSALVSAKVDAVFSRMKRVCKKSVATKCLATKCNVSIASRLSATTAATILREACCAKVSISTSLQGTVSYSGVTSQFAKMQLPYHRSRGAPIDTRGRYHG